VVLHGDTALQEIAVGILTQAAVGAGVTQAIVEAIIADLLQAQVQVPDLVLVQEVVAGHPTQVEVGLQVAQGHPAQVLHQEVGLHQVAAGPREAVEGVVKR
jgi:menaquinone-dependent protoporphyrinogen IX oxidase